MSTVKRDAARGNADAARGVGEVSEQLPRGWSSVKLRDVAKDISYGFTASASDEADGPRMLRITDIQDNSVNWATVPRCECADPTKYLLRAGDIVVARTGATTGKSFLLREVPEPSVFASYLIRVQPSNAVAPGFLANYMLSPTYWEQITVVSKGTAQPGANASILGALDVPLAPLNEQRRIVAKLGALQARSRRAREALDAVPPLLEKLRQSILAAAFRGDLTKDWRAKNKNVEPASKLLERIRTERRKKWEEAELAKLKAKGKPPTDDEWKSKYKEPAPLDTTGLPALPEGWCWASVYELSTRVTDGTHQSPAFSADGIPFIVIANVIDGAIDWSSVSKWVSRETYEENTARCVPQRGDVLYTAVGSYGIALTVDTDEPFMFQRHIAHIKPIVSMIRPDAFAMLLNAPQSRARADQVARGVAQKTVTLGELSTFPIPVAPSNEQTRIVEVAQELLASVTRHERRLSELARNLASLERSILAKAFRGELVPQDPSDEPADADDAHPNHDSRISQVPASSKRARATRRKAS